MTATTRIPKNAEVEFEEMAKQSNFPKHTARHVVVIAALLIHLFLFGGPVAFAADEWKQLVQTDDISVYIETTTLTKNGRLASASTLVNYATPDRAFNGKTYQSTLTRTNFNCGKRQTRVAVLSFYSDKWAGGQKVYETDKSDVWRAINYGSPNESVLNAVCSSKAISK